MNCDPMSGVLDSLDTYLDRAGVIDIGRRTEALPLGEWAGSVGSLMATDVRSLFTSLIPAFAATFDVRAEDCSDLIRTPQEEWERHHVTYSFVFATGRRPL